MRDTNDKVVAVKGSTNMASELRALTSAAPIVTMREDGSPQISAQAIRYNSWSVDLGGFTERMLPGSAVLDPDLVALFDHDTAKVLGRTSAGTMSVMPTDAGVSFTATPPNTSWASDLLESMKRGDIRGCSFRMMVDEDKWYVEGGQVKRDVIKARVSELTVTSMPAYPETTAEARGRAEALRKLTKVEERIGRILSGANEQVLIDALNKIELAGDAIAAVILSVNPSFNEDQLDAETSEQGDPVEGSSQSDSEILAGSVGSTEMDSEEPRSSAGAVERKKAGTFVPGFGFIPSLNK